jgi:mannitol-specific phosphotransferase system IIBC component
MNTAVEVLLWLLAVLAAAFVAFIIAAMVVVVVAKARDAERTKLEAFHRRVKELASQRQLVDWTELEQLERELWPND